MKRLMLFCLAAVTSLTAADPTGAEILNKIIDLMNPENAKAVMEQTIVTTSGDKRTFQYETYMGNRGESSLMRYLEPSRVKGNAMLMTGFSDNIWMYNRRTDRVRKLASSAKNQKFEGSDFTYEDMGSGDSWKEDYTPVLKGIEKIDREKCYTLELQLKSDDNSYKKMICFARLEDFFPIQIDYYDENDVLSKSLYLEDIQTVEGIPTPMKMTMSNHLDKTETVMEYTSITYDVEFDKYFFTERNLKK
ncbi:outer membrane lipoprotein-sorting protein [bacterium]|nr:outer membrane lipoprotein-sorting protein [bacterium]MBU1064458.1 outer membrane lipoprotein-sorting protein [bacterium]MBU1634012.1 outer membrane lipoprotein-sorting protein [bacterium]MBU1874865.1 outer membrane lipoprotein-sorting protein [bacterium]